MPMYVSAAALRAPLVAALFVCAAALPALAQVPAPWSARDIGAPQLSGSASYSSGVFTIDAAGVDIWGSSDQFHFVYQAIAGDVEISAKVNSLERVYSWTNAGVMIRASLSAGAAHAYMAATGSNGLHFRRRLASGATTSGTSGAAVAPPVWVRLVRQGTTVTSYSSSTGSTWTKVGTVTLPLGSTAYVGMAVSSHDADTRATAQLSSVKVVPVGSLPSGIEGRDIGAPALPGAASYSAGAFRITAAGRDIWDAADQFHYVYRPVTGNVQVTARVTSLLATDVWSKSGVMIRESLTAQSRHASTFASAAKGYAFQRRPEPGAYTEHTAGGSGAPPGWVRLVRSGDLFESYQSVDGLTWRKIGADTIAMTDTVYVGIATTSHNVAAVTSAVVDSFIITLSGGSSGGNAPPAISITAPATGAAIPVSTLVTVTATATDPEGRMASVDFYEGTRLILRDTTAPYAAAWSPSVAATYRLTAVAHDSDGASSVSSAVTVTVGGTSTTTAPKYVVFDASSDHSTNVSKYVFKVYAAGADPATATPIATSDLGKPTPSSTGEITVDRSTFFSSLPAGTYVSTVSAVNSAGPTASAAVAFTR